MIHQSITALWSIGDLRGYCSGSARGPFALYVILDASRQFHQCQVKAFITQHTEDVQELVPAEQKRISCLLLRSIRPLHQARHHAPVLFTDDRSCYNPIQQQRWLASLPLWPQRRAHHSNLFATGLKMVLLAILRGGTCAYAVPKLPRTDPR